MHTTVSKQPDGSFKASCNVIGVPDVSAPTESLAILKVRAEIEKWFGGGGNGRQA